MIVLHCFAKLSNIAVRQMVYKVSRQVGPSSTDKDNLVYFLLIDIVTSKGMNRGWLRGGLRASGKDHVSFFEEKSF